MRGGWSFEFCAQSDLSTLNAVVQFPRDKFNAEQALSTPLFTLPFTGFHSHHHFIISSRAHHRLLVDHLGAVLRPLGAIDADTVGDLVHLRADRVDLRRRQLLVRRGLVG